jgi:hypothetical protein
LQEKKGGKKKKGESKRGEKKKKKKKDYFFPIKLRYGKTNKTFLLLYEKGINHHINTKSNAVLDPVSTVTLISSLLDLNKDEIKDDFKSDNKKK